MHTFRTLACSHRPTGGLVFGANDFDETLPGPWEWDVKRLAASLAVSGRENGSRLAEQRTIVVRGRRASYRGRCASSPTMTNLAVWYARRRSIRGASTLSRSQLDAKRMKLLETNLAKTRTRDSLHAFSRLTEIVDGKPRIISAPPLIQPARDMLEERARRGSASSSCGEMVRELSRVAAERPPRAARAVSLRRHRAQGGRRRQRRHARVDRAADGQGRRRSAVPAVQGSAGFGARGVPRAERVLDATASGWSPAST